MYFVDGAIVAPKGNFTNDPATDTNGQLKPIAYDMSSHSGNSFHLPFTDNAGEQVFADSSSSGHTVTANGNVRHTRAEKEIDSSSIYFDGTGDYLSVASDAEFGMGTGNFTIEFWVQFSTINSYQWMVGGASSNTLDVSYYSSGGLTCFLDNGSSSKQFAWSPVVDTWYHVAVVRSGTDDLKAYVDGTQIGSTLTETYDIPTQGVVFGRQYDGSYQLDGYLDDIRIVKGTAITPPSGGPSSALTAVSGTSLLIHSDWADGGLGGDSSGNFNDFNLTNLVASDQMNDRPTNNYAVLNGLLPQTGTIRTLAEGNLKLTTPGASYTGTTSATMPLPATGKYYWEVYADTVNYMMIGICAGNFDMTSYLQTASSGGFKTYYSYSGKKMDSHNTTVGTEYGDTWSAGEVIGVAVDMDNNAIYFANEGVWQDGGDPTSGASKTDAAFTDLATDTDLVGQELFPVGGDVNYASSDVFVFNFGQDPTFDGNDPVATPATSEFAYTPPAGYSALSTANLPDPTIAKGNEYFDTQLWTGQDSSSSTSIRDIDGYAFQPDLVWAKARTTGYGHRLIDSGTGRGGGEEIFPNTPDSNYSVDSGGHLSGFNVDGFEVKETLGSPTTNNLNYDGIKYVAWCWKADSVAGMDVVTYEGNSSTTGTASLSSAISHGTGGSIDFAMFKDLENYDSWKVWHKDLASDTSLYLDTGGTSNSTGAHMLPISTWTDTTFKVGNHDDGYGFGSGDAGWRLNAASTDYVAYLFSEVAGYSKFGVYEGNNDADGPFAWCGFRPAWLLIKRFDATEDWWILDVKRDTYNVVNHLLYANEPNTEPTPETTDNIPCDIISNGFKIRTANVNWNALSGDYIFAAFAEQPFKYAAAR